MVDDLVHVRLESDDFPASELQIFDLAGREAMGELFSFELGVHATTENGLDDHEIEGRKLTLVFEVGGQEIRRVHGIVARVVDKLDTEVTSRSYSLLLVPRAHRLTLVRTQEIFMNQTVPEIIQHKLELVGLGANDVQMRLSGSYPKREFVVQYRESDLAFISRLAEHLGITFFFEHGDDDKIVFTDHGFPELVDEDRSGDAKRGDHKMIANFRGRGERRDVFSIVQATQLVPTLHVVHDYNYSMPLVEPLGTNDAPSGFAGGVVDYGAHVDTPAHAAELAKVRAQETEATHKVFDFESDLGRLTAGFTVTIDGHPRLGATPLQMLEVVHDARQGVALHAGGPLRPYTNKVRAISAALTFRPPRATPRPRIHGVLHGVIAHEIEGTDSLFARLDDQGRYLVRFKFDTSPPGERGTASHRIRMMQPHAGSNYGNHLPLKPGIEVLLAFVDGDPDRPIIVGTAPNPVTSSPVAANCAPAHRIKTATGILIEMKDA